MKQRNHVGEFVEITTVGKAIEMEANDDPSEKVAMFSDRLGDGNIVIRLRDCPQILSKLKEDRAGLAFQITQMEAAISASTEA